MISSQGMQAGWLQALNERNRIELQLQGLQGHTSTLCLFISFSELENIGTTDPGNRVSS